MKPECTQWSRVLIVWMWWNRPKMEHTGLIFWSQEQSWITQAWLSEVRNKVVTHKPDFLKPGTKMEPTSLTFWSQEQSWNTQACLSGVRNKVGTHRTAGYFCRIISKWETLVCETLGLWKYFLRIDVHVNRENCVITSLPNMTMFPHQRTCKDIKFIFGRWCVGEKSQRICDLYTCCIETETCMLCIVFTKGL